MTILYDCTAWEYQVGSAVLSTGGRLWQRVWYVTMTARVGVVYSSPSHTDTIPGRQCMASCFFLLRQFDDVLLYLNSVKVTPQPYKHTYLIYNLTPLSSHHLPLFQIQIHYILPLFCCRAISSIWTRSTSTLLRPRLPLGTIKRLRRCSCSLTQRH